MCNMEPESTAGASKSEPAADFATETTEDAPKMSKSEPAADIATASAKRHQLSCLLRIRQLIREISSTPRPVTNVQPSYHGKRTGGLPPWT